MRDNLTFTEAVDTKKVRIYYFIMTLLIIAVLAVTFGLSKIYAQSINPTPTELYSGASVTTPPDTLVVTKDSTEVMEDTVEINTNPIHKVRATFYNPTVGQTDGSPNRTATGFEIDLNNPYKHRIIAISPDLERMGYHMGDSVNICINNKEKAIHYNGHYIVQDRMPSQHSRKIDLLVSSDMYMTYLKDVEIQKLN